MNAFLKVLFFAALIAAIVWAVLLVQEPETNFIVGAPAPVGERNSPSIDDSEISTRMGQVFNRVREEKLNASKYGMKFKFWAKLISVFGVFSSVAITGIAAFFGVWKPENKGGSFGKKKTNKRSIAVASLALLTAICPPVSDAANQESIDLFRRTDSLQTEISETRSMICAGDLEKAEILNLLDDLELKCDR